MNASQKTKSSGSVPRFVLGFGASVIARPLFGTNVPLPKVSHHAVYGKKNERPWWYLHRDGRLVYDCCDQFFKYHFYRESTQAQATPTTPAMETEPAHDPTTATPTDDVSGVDLPRFVRPAWMTGSPDCDWTEDSDHENGNYYNKCVGCHSDFIGHKRRHVCRKCVKESQAKYDAMTEEERSAFDAERLVAITGR